MKIDYEVIWAENNKMKFKQFSYEVDKESFPLSSHLPDEVYQFFRGLREKSIHAIVAVGEEQTGTGILRYSGADPVYC